MKAFTIRIVRTNNLINSIPQIAKFGKPQAFITRSNVIILIAIFATDSQNYFYFPSMVYGYFCYTDKSINLFFRKVIIQIPSIPPIHPLGMHPGHGQSPSIAYYGNQPLHRLHLTSNILLCIVKGNEKPDNEHIR